MERIITIDQMIIFPNRGLHVEIPSKFIISARGFELHFEKGRTIPQIDYYWTGTDTVQVYDRFWNILLSDEDRVPAITHMLYRLGQQYGMTFRYIQSIKTENNETN